LPTHNINVCAIHPEGNFAPHWIKGRSFQQNEGGIAGVEKFMAKYGTLGYGLYFYDNDLKVVRYSASATGSRPSSRPIVT
jgi:hypothetical protein